MRPYQGGRAGVDTRIALVTGAGRGLGRSYAKALAAAGMKIAVLDVIDPAETAEEIVQAGGEATHYVADITKEPEVTAVVHDIVDRWGRIDVLVNNAALFGGLGRSPFEEITPAEFARVLEVNVTGQFVCVRAVAPHMRRGGWGRIVNITSGAALKGLPNFLHYVTSKGAIVAFTRALARELGPHGITVNAIAPGLTLSESVLDDPQAAAAPLQNRAIPRDEYPEDLHGTLLWLCSDGAGFVTGQTVAVDGGSVML